MGSSTDIEDATMTPLLADAVDVATDRCATDGPGRETMSELIRGYYRHVAAEDLDGCSAEDLAGAAVSHYEFACQRPQGRANVRVFTPTVDEDGWSAAGHTVVEVVTDDMPFLVDSVSAALAQAGSVLDLVVHPQFLVTRDVTGALRDMEAAPSAPAEIANDQVRESWMHIEIDRSVSAAALAELERNLAKVLSDVRVTVEDWPKMKVQALEIVDSLGADPPPLPDSEVDESRELLSWLADEHFTFLGYREYVLDTVDGEDVLRAVPGTGLGILRFDQIMSESFGRLPAPVRAKAREKRLMIVTKANSRATVHRSVYLDYVSIKTFDAAGEVAGERRFLGLFTSAAYTESINHIPILRRKAAELLDRLGFAPDSHSGKALMDLLETFPRDEFFQTSIDDLAATTSVVVHLQERRRVRLFVRGDEYGRFLSCLVYLPRDRYTTAVRLRMHKILASAVGGEATVDFTARVTESVLARLHFVVRPQEGHSVGNIDVAALEQRISDATRSWEDDFTKAADDLLGQAEANDLVAEYTDAFPEAYKEDFGARSAVADLRRLQSIDQGEGIGLQLYTPAAAGVGEARLKVFRTGSPLSLSEVLPLFVALGVEVIDERPYHLEPASGPAWIYDFGMRHSGEIRDDTRILFQDAFMACWRGQAEADGFNRLVMGGGMHWRDVSILRAYAKYMRQGGSTFGQDYIEQSLLANIKITRLLVDLFDARFRPGDRGVTADSEARIALADKIEGRIEEALDSVSSLDQDRILRAYLMLIRATLRTNFYQPDDVGRPKSYTSFKLEPKRIDFLPEPRPRYEIFVHSPRVEGVHLRFGAVARGGLRWSDRREDFRTEVLGLVKAQMVKNAVIVPVGAKGGFYCKQLPGMAADREAWLAEGISCYKTFICGLLDITDNLVAGETVPPPHVLRHDGDDTYLVVAADKGTATFSDIANEVSKDYDYWLGDAFASGGSVGYDHKAMGITARGAWESVRRHFRELGVDCQNEDFSCVGVGDMSGDVFGNGMLLSEHIRLVAAFDHRHIFVDPDPDPAASYTERRRLFALPRSSWADYGRELMSAGGGVFDRTVKAIPVSRQMRTALGIEGSATSMTPQLLMNAILKAPVDLLWNGGIGTYVKAVTESHADAGDKANDAIRVNGNELRCRSVGEGGNLGLTQLARIEYARQGGRINTDFIDNSAGVDTSDHEVNIKILLDRVVADATMTQDERTDLLVRMTEEVGTLVLADNYHQNLALANAMEQAPGLLHVHGDWIRRLERAGLIDRGLEFLPSSKEIAARLADGRGLTAPELSVLLAYTKIVLADELLDSDLPDDPFMRGHLFRYFPSQMRQDYRERMDDHPLRREIIVTQIVNEFVNDAGITFYHRLSGETGADAAELARAHAIAKEIFGVAELFDQINELDNVVDARRQTQMRLAVRTLAERATRWLVNNRRHLDADAAADYFDTMVQEVVRALPDVLVGREKAELDKRAEELTGAGVPSALALQVAAMPPAYQALAVVNTARRASIDPIEVARLHSGLGERLGLDHIVAQILALPRDDRWRTMARASLRDDLHAVHAQLTARVFAQTDASLGPEERIDAWAESEGTVLKRSMETLEEVWAEDSADLARLSVGLRVVRALVSGGA